MTNPLIMLFNYSFTVLMNIIFFIFLHEVHKNFYDWIKKDNTKLAYLVMIPCGIFLLAIDVWSVFIMIVEVLNLIKNT